MSLEPASLIESKEILDFGEISLNDVGRVGGKNASLGELFRALGPAGVGVLDGFATSSDAYWRLLETNALGNRLRAIFATPFDAGNVAELGALGRAARAAVRDTPLPQSLRTAVLDARERLFARLGHETELAVRSSATAEDLPEASFAGAAETFLNVRGPEGLLKAVHGCYASLFTDRAISYRARLGYDQLKVALSVGVMPMVRSDRACSGVLFTLDTESGFRDVVTVSSAWGLGEFVVQGVVTPDEWTVFKPALRTGHPAIVGRRLGSKEQRLVYGANGGTISEPTAKDERGRFSLPDAEVLTLARWGCAIEEHYSSLAGHPQPMDIEWAKDGLTGRLVIVQARPETVHSHRPRAAQGEIHHLGEGARDILVRGQAVGERIGCGVVRVVRRLDELDRVKEGEVLVAELTDPDWEPVMRRVAAIVTDKGGRTAHAAIVSREFGLPCIVGAGDATRLLHDGQEVTVCCAEGSEGRVYQGRLPITVERLEATTPPKTRTRVMLIVGDPSQAFRLAEIPNSGVGLARSEFIVTNSIGVHPMALARHPHLKDAGAVRAIERLTGGQDPREYFVQRFSEEIGRIAAAFYPNPVVVRTSDFKTNEYARLLGGPEFEPDEENPMIGFRGAARYYDPRYAAGFALECAALRRARVELGLSNIEVMIPFCRTVEEGRRVLDTMAHNGLARGDSGLEVYMMCEVPSNAVLAEDFLTIFDGYSIGSNDLTQLTLGLDRDSGTLAHLFDERDPAVKWLIARAIAAAKRLGKPIGICGQAPSDHPDFVAWLVRQGIDSISLNPDAVLSTIPRIVGAEAQEHPASVCA
jgi:pyruvate,water dikinase